MNNILLIAGSRNLHPDYHTLDAASYLFDVPFDKIISGGAKGVDTIAREWAIVRDYNFEEFLAEWDTYGKKAGYIRNKEMVEECTHAIIVYDGSSLGTKHTIDLLEKENKPYVLLRNI